MRIYLVLAIVLISNSHSIVKAHECHHEPTNSLISVPNEGASNFGDYLTNVNERNLQSSVFRITYDISQIQQTVTNPTQYSLVTKALQIAKLFYQNLAVPINPFQGTVTPKANSNCPYSFTTAQLAEKVSNTDFHFYIQSQTVSSGQTWIAKSSPCLTQQTDQRTIMGVVTVNLNYLSEMSSSNYDFQNYVDVFIHEMFHSIAFSQDLFPLYLNPNTGSAYQVGVDYNTVQANGNYFVAFPNCVKWAQQYYSCATITQVPLEDNGSPGSAGAHWERTILQNDIMTASSLAGDNLWSGLNNALLLDSGWYKLRTDQTPFALDDRIIWGKGEGCDFFFNRCSQLIFPEFCSVVSQVGNTFSANGLGFCSNLDIYSQCPYMAPYKNQLCFNETNKYEPQLGGTMYSLYFEQYDATARSFVSTLSPTYLNSLDSYFAVCYLYTCSTDNKSLTIHVGPRDIQCQKDGQVISNVEGFNGSITCPSSISNFCYNFLSCPSYCSHRGYCISGQCRCLSGIKGLNSTNCECDDGYYVNESESACQSCNVPSCQRCSTVNSCTQCKQGYYLSSSSSCLPCPSNCVDCNSSGQCIKCQLGYFQQSISSDCLFVSSVSSQYLQYSSGALILIVLLSLLQ